MELNGLRFKMRFHLKILDNVKQDGKYLNMYIITQYIQKEETLMRLEALAREDFSDKDNHLSKMKK